MTPAARHAAAIDLLEQILVGDPAEKCLTRWARGNRYAGSKDRAAIRDLVFDAIRCQRSYAWLGGAGHQPTARAVILGSLRAKGQDPALVFTGDKYAPDSLGPEELAAPDLDDAPRGVQLDCPDWLLPKFDEALGAQCDDVLRLMRQRAPVFLRVNLRKTDVSTAIEALARDDIDAQPHPLSPSALEVTRNSRRIAHSAAFAQGLVELQDAASQAVVDMVPLSSGMSVLDYCAGGGGKLLAMGAKHDIALTAHDVDARRMSDIPMRAGRAGLDPVTIAAPGSPGGDYDVVFVDAPCSGSGAWRRTPQAKWLLDMRRLSELVALQGDVLQQAAVCCRPGGMLVYATCSLFKAENDGQVDAFLSDNPEWQERDRRHFTPCDGGDGFFAAVLTRG